MAVTVKTQKTEKQAVARRQARVKWILRRAGAGLMAFFAAGVPLQGTVSPFGTAFAAGSPDRLLLPSVLGAAAGAAVFTQPVTAVKNVGAALLLFVSRQAVERLGGGARSALWDPLLAFCAVLVASAAAGFFTPLTPTLMLTYFGEALLTGCLTVLLRRAGVVLGGKAKPVLTAPADAVSVLLALGIELVFFSRVRLGGLDLAFLLAEALLPTFAFTAGPYAAGAVGVTLGAILGFRAGSGYLVFALPLAGFLVCAAAPFGRASAAATNALTQLVFLFLKGESPFLPPALVILAGSLLLLLLPVSLLSRVEAALTPLTREQPAAAIRTKLTLDLKNAAAAVRDVAAAVTKAGALQGEATGAAELRRLGAAAFGKAGAVLEEAAGRVPDSGAPEPYLAALCADALAAAGVAVRDVAAETLADGRRTLTALCPVLPETLDADAMVAALRLKTGLDFAPPAVQGLKKEGALLLFCEVGALRVESAKRVQAASGQGICGDAVSRFHDGRGRFYCVVSDGMGTGRTAALDAMLAVSLMTRLLKSGVSPETALSCVNLALMQKATEETLATLDVLQADLFTGEARLLKAGAAASAVRLGEKTLQVERSSLPLGILPEVKFEETAFTLSPGDLVLMTTDGADRVKPAVLRGLLDADRDAPPDTLAERVMAEAVARSPVGHRDDISVVAIRFLSAGRRFRPAQAEPDAARPDA